MMNLFNSPPPLRDGEPCGRVLNCMGHYPYPCKGCGRLAGLPIPLGLRWLVVAGNHRQFLEHVKEHNLPIKQSVYLNTEESCLGYDNYILIFVGTYHDNPVYQDADIRRKLKINAWKVFE